jgi:hypothetical protein
MAAALKAIGVQCPMPRIFLRLLAVALLALAIPLQGLAAVTAGQCMTFGHHQDAGHESHGDAQDGEDGHDHAAHSHSDESAGNADDEGAGAHCGPCTACCASASIAGPQGLSILSDPSDAQYVFSQFPPIGVQPDGLDRPPLAL